MALSGNLSLLHVDAHDLLPVGKEPSLDRRGHPRGSHDSVDQTQAFDQPHASRAVLVSAEHPDQTRGMSKRERVRCRVPRSAQGISATRVQKNDDRRLRAETGRLTSLRHVEHEIAEHDDEGVGLR